MSDYHLAHLNIAYLKAPLDSPLLASFVAQLDTVNGLADTAPGFIWRLSDNRDSAAAASPFGVEYVVNLSVWKDMTSLHDFVFQGGHLQVMRRRREWFQTMDEASMVLWWLPVGHYPDEAAAQARLQRLRDQGPNPLAFTFRQPFPPPSAVSDPLRIDDTRSVSRP